MKKKYEKPDIIKQEKMTFPMDGLKTFINRKCQDCPEKQCYIECVNYAPMGCRQCSSCHACR